MSDIDTRRRVLRESHTLAIVGLSPDPMRSSYSVAKSMQEHGYRIVPVNPKYGEILGETCYPSLTAIPAEVAAAIDLVDVFRKSSDAPAIARDAVAIGAKTLWLQLGVISDEAKKIAEDAGLSVVMDRCIKIEHDRLCRDFD